MTESSDTACVILEAVRASLLLASNTPQLLSLAQLLILKDELHETLAVIDSHVQAELKKPDDRTVIIDSSDWERTSDEEEEGGSAANSKGANAPLPIPGPYPMVPPKLDVLPDRWFVVARGREVGIFPSIEASTRAVTGIFRAYKVRVRTWPEAATLYNRLYHKGDIVRVHA